MGVEASTDKGAIANPAAETFLKKVLRVVVFMVFMEQLIKVS